MIRNSDGTLLSVVAIEHSRNGLVLVCLLNGQPAAKRRYLPDEVEADRGLAEIFDTIRATQLVNALNQAEEVVDSAIAAVKTESEQPTPPARSSATSPPAATRAATKPKVGSRPKSKHVAPNPKVKK